MTEEAFKKTMTKVICFVVIALIAIVIMGVVVFGTSQKQTSIFENQAEIDNYKKKVQEINAHKITEDEIKELEENVPEGEETPEEVVEESEEPPEVPPEE